MKVELIAYTQRPGAEPGQNPLSVVEQAACMCYDSKQTESNAIECHERQAGITDCGPCPLYGVIDCSYILAEQTRKRLEANGGV